MDSLMEMYLTELSGKSRAYFHDVTKFHESTPIHGASSYNLKTPRGQVLSKGAPNEGKHFHSRLLQLHPFHALIWTPGVSVTIGLIQARTSMFHSRIFPSVLCPLLHTGLLMSPSHVWSGPGSHKRTLHTNFNHSLYSFQCAKSSQFPKI